MSSLVQHAWTSPVLSVGTGVGRAPERTDEPAWLNAAAPNGQHEEKHSGGYVQGGRWVQVAYAILDACCVVTSGALAFLVRSSPANLRRLIASRSWAFAAHQGLTHYAAFVLLYVALVLLFCQWQDLYWTPRTRSAFEESRAVIKAVSFATMILIAFLFLSGDNVVSPIIVVTSFLLNGIGLTVWRCWKRRIVIRRVEQGIGARNVAIVGAGEIGQALARQFDENKLLGYLFKGFLDGNHSRDPRLLGKIEDLPRVARSEFLDEVFITIPSERELVKRIAIEARRQRLDVKVVPDLYDGLAWKMPVHHIGNFPVMSLNWQSIPVFGLFIKRVLDVCLSLIGLLLSGPICASLALWIMLDSPGPALYRSQRMGKKGQAFTCYKLRTMVANADELKNSLRCQNERQGPFFKISEDPRVTRAGRILRKYSLDELPQLWNVLKGDMSLVGPRPHPLDDCKQYDLDQLRRLEVKPGITCLWQLEARRDPSFDTALRLDMQYIENWSLWLDLKTLVRTLPRVLVGEGQ
jgi:exopolysaccharide biosynthesis polyprenyl glycosylphosphotransferase